MAEFPVLLLLPAASMTGRVGLTSEAVSCKMQLDCETVERCSMSCGCCLDKKPLWDNRKRLDFRFRT